MKKSKKKIRGLNKQSQPSPSTQKIQLKLEQKEIEKEVKKAKLAPPTLEQQACKHAKTAARILNMYKFGHLEQEDLEQQASMWALEALPKYDEDKCLSLYNFIFTHVKNQLFNWRRKHLTRISPPCDKCPLNAFINGECTAYTDLSDCEYWRAWLARNQQKKQLAAAAPTGAPSEHPVPGFIADSDMRDELTHILDNLPDHLYHRVVDFLQGDKMREGKFNQLVEEIRMEIGLDG